MPMDIFEILHVVVDGRNDVKRVYIVVSDSHGDDAKANYISSSLEHAGSLIVETLGDRYASALTANECAERLANATGSTVMPYLA